MKQLLYKYWLLPITLFIGLLSSLLSTHFTASVSAHGGGTPRLTSAPVGPYRLYAWSEPEPWRVGQVHLSLAVTLPNPDNNSNQIELPVTDVDITVTFTPVADNTAVTPAGGSTSNAIVVKATLQEFLTDFYYEADPVLPQEGAWQVAVAVAGKEGSGDVEFAIETLPERSLNWTLIASAGGVLIVILALMLIWSRSQKVAQPVRHRHQGVRRVQPRSGKIRIRNTNC